MEAAAARAPGYLGIVSARGGEGMGITVSYWLDDASARAWRDDPAHARIRERGRAGWYEAYDLTVAEIVRGYSWQADAAIE